MTEERHDILPRIIALLLSLALLAERFASRPPAERLFVCPVFLRAQHAALSLIDFPDDATLTQTLHETPDFLEDGCGVGTFVRLAMVFRAVAAALMHACLTNGMPQPRAPRYSIILLLNRAAHPLPRCFPIAIGFVQDTS